MENCSGCFLKKFFSIWQRPDSGLAVCAGLRISSSADFFFTVACLGLAVRPGPPEILRPLTATIQSNVADIDKECVRFVLGAGLTAERHAGRNQDKTGWLMEENDSK